jgi:2-polyprenyl-6-methoxyphenol hydroxylase-like FAD-dependent oxidoreductase
VSETVAIVGAGICGLCTGLALAKSGHQVTIIERDSPPPEGGPDEAFFDWNRRGAAQFRHPHAFLAVMSNLLEESFPDLIEDFWAAGARKISFKDMLPPGTEDDYVPEPGDEKLWLLMCRRATMETVIRSYAERAENLDILSDSNVTEVIADVADGQIVVRGIGLRTRDGEERELRADLVIDASGRGSKFKEWLGNLGASFEIEDDDAEIVYFTRHYKLKPGVEEPPRRGKERSAGDLGYIKYGVFPGDGGHFAVILCLPNHETELRDAVRKGELFDRICCAIPGLLPWVDSEKSEATTHSFGFGDIHSVWTHFVKDGRPAALNYFAVGDAAVRTNPLYGRGCSTGIIHAHLLARLIGQVDDPRERALTFDRWTEEELRPIFKTSLREDKNGIKRAKAILEGRAIDEAKSLKRWFTMAFGDAVARASREKVHVMRGAMRTFNLMEKPGEFLNDWRTRLIVLRYMLYGRKENAKARRQNGPTREEMLALVREEGLTRAAS